MQITDNPDVYRELLSQTHDLHDRLQKAHHNVSELELQKFKLSFALECAQSLTWELTVDLETVVFCENFDKLLGIKQTDYDYKFMDFITLHLSPYKELILQQMNDYIAGKTDMIVIEISIFDINGNLHWLFVRGKFLDNEKKIIYGVSVDITERVNFERRLADLAYKDSLTSVYKVAYITDAAAGRIKGVELSNIGLMVLDICNFRTINEAFGHECGNTVLMLTARRLKEIAGNQILVRVGGDEFIIVFNNISDSQQMKKMANFIIEKFKKPLQADGQIYYINFKIGMAINKDEKSDFELLFKDAESALHYAKKDDHKNICVINDDIRKSMKDMVYMTYELREAIEQKEFILNFQPIISAKTKKLVGTEALVRWAHPKRGIIAPSHFILLAEETGLIKQIGDFVLEESVKQLRNWLDIDNNIFVSVNVSAIQFMSIGFIDRILQLVKEYSIPPSYLVIEITESIFISDVPHIIDSLQTLRKAGIKLSLDDFGTGYSSLSYLRQLPLDNLKIDREFLIDVLNNSTSDAILRSIISLARNLNLSITAEGVETKGQLSLLEEYGCDFLQGYYFSKPVPADKIYEFLVSGIQ